MRGLCREIYSGSSKQELAGMLTLKIRGHREISQKDTIDVRDVSALWFKGHIQYGLYPLL